MGDVKIVFSGALGRMGQALLPGLCETEGLCVVGEVDKGDDLLEVVRASGADVVVDFTQPDAAMGNARKIIEAGAQGVIGTTGFTLEDLSALDTEAKQAGVGLLVAPNFALGMILLQRFAEEAARHFPSVEVLEAHHPQKLDAPSGTALATARRIAAAGGRAAANTADPSRGLVVDGVPVHSIRLPGVVARQEVLFGGHGERLRIEHDTMSRECFLPGVVEGIRRMSGRVGLVHGLDALLFAEA
jgi:4-hydroxy-tetrahydrodipicolinate reductase